MLYQQSFVIGLSNRLFERASRGRKRTEAGIRSMIIILNYSTQKIYIKPDRLYTILAGKLVWSDIQ